MYEKEKKEWINRAEKFLCEAEELGIGKCFPDVEPAINKFREELGDGDEIGMIINMDKIKREGFKL